MTCAPCEDLDQPRHPSSLIRVFAVRMNKALVLSYPLSAQRRLIRLDGCPGWSESWSLLIFLLHWAGRSVCWLCHALADQSSMCALWVANGKNFLREDCDQTGCMARLNAQADLCLCWPHKSFEPVHDKTNKVTVRPAKTWISLGIRPVWSESSLSAWIKLGSLATQWAHSEDWSDWMDAQANLSLRWADRSYYWFCHALADKLSMCALWVANGKKLSTWGQRRLWSHWVHAQIECTGRSVHLCLCWPHKSFEPVHDKTNKVTVSPTKTWISLGNRPVWSVFAVRMNKAWVLTYPLSA